MLVRYKKNRDLLKGNSWKGITSEEGDYECVVFKVHVYGNVILRW